MDEEKDFAIYYMKQRYHWLERMWNLRKSIIIPESVKLNIFLCRYD